MYDNVTLFMRQTFEDARYMTSVRMCRITAVIRPNTVSGVTVQPLLVTIVSFNASVSGLAIENIRI